MKLRTAGIASALLLVARLAAASPTTAEGWYDEGQTQYTLGNFERAVDAFKKGFELETAESKKPAYLYNIAQAYRQANDCKNSVFFYKRFLALKANDTVKPLSPERKAEVDGWIKDGEACIKQQDDLRSKTPDGTVKPGDDGSHRPIDTAKPRPPVTATVTVKPKPAETHVATTEGDGGAETTTESGTEDGAVHARAAGDAPHLVAVRLLGGGTKVSAGDLKFPVQGTGTLLAGYPLAINPQLTLELGAGFTFTPVPFDNMDTGASTTAKMFSVFANVGGRYAVAPKIAVRLDVGVGALVFSGLADGNPFTEDGAGTTGALTMLHVRGGVSADYQISQSLAVTVTPIAFGYSPAKSGLRSDISSLTSIDFMIGLGYRM